PIGCPLIWQDDETILVYGGLPTQGDGGGRSIATFDIHSESIVDIAPLPTDWYRTSPDGQLRLSNEGDVTSLVDVETNSIIADLPIDSDLRLFPVWASDSDSLLVTDTSEDTIFVWTGDDFRQIANKEIIYEIDYLPSIDLLVGGSMFQRITIWNLNTDEVNQLNWTAQDIAFNHDGTYLAGVGTHYLTIWNMRHFHEQ
ncbi:MAG: hypothetical protein AAFR67_11600, partial [Chloroflexota bacterium]